MKRKKKQKTAFLTEGASMFNRLATRSDQEEKPVLNDVNNCIRIVECGLVPCMHVHCSFVKIRRADSCLKAMQR